MALLLYFLPKFNGVWSPSVRKWANGWATIAPPGKTNRREMLNLLTRALSLGLNLKPQLSHFAYPSPDFAGCEKCKLWLQFSTPVEHKAL